MYTIGTMILPFIGGHLEAMGVMFWVKHEMPTDRTIRLQDLLKKIQKKTILCDIMGYLWLWMGQERVEQNMGGGRRGSTSNGISSTYRKASHSERKNISSLPAFLDLLSRVGVGVQESIYRTSSVPVAASPVWREPPSCPVLISVAHFLAKMRTTLSQPSPWVTQPPADSMLWEAGLARSLTAMGGSKRSPCDCVPSTPGPGIFINEGSRLAGGAGHSAEDPKSGATWPTTNMQQKPKSTRTLDAVAFESIQREGEAEGTVWRLGGLHLT